MDRGSVWTWNLASLSLFLGLAGLAGAVALVFWPGGTAEAAKPAPNGWRVLEPVTYENLSIFPVVSSQALDTTAFVTLDEALASGDAVVTEQGSEIIRRSRDGRPMSQIWPPRDGGATVNRLVLINRGKKPLILLAGELVSGGKQDRVIAKDRIVAPGADPLPLDVFCVEQGRWSASGGAGAGGGANFFAPKVMAHPSVREKAAVDRKQTEVWDAVKSGTTARSESANAAAAPPRIAARDLAEVVASEAPTVSYGKIYKSSRVGGSVESFAEEVERRFRRATASLKGERVVGVVVAYGGEVAWSDVFASSQLFDRYWSKLVRSYAVEALARPQTKEQATLADAREFLRPLKGHESVESEPGVYRWRQVTEGRYAEIEISSLEPKEMTLHRLKVHRTS